MILGVACEDHGHFSAVTYLVDAALLNEHDWLNDIIESCRSWCGLESTEPWYKYDPRDAHDVRPVVLGGVRIAGHGHIKGKPLELEAGMWRRVLLLFCHRDPRPDVVLLVRDMDGYRDRIKGMKQARDGFDWPFSVVIAAPEPEIEAWHVTGFDPVSTKERETLEELRISLSFDPTLEPHRLTSHPNDAVTDAKLVLAALCDGDRDRRLLCIANPSQLRERGAFNGLTEFLAEVDARIVPLLGSRSA